MKSLKDASRLEGLRKDDDSLLLFLVGEGRENGCLTYDQVIDIPSNKLKRFNLMLVDLRIKVIDEAEIGECQICAGCGKSKPIKFAFFYQNPKISQRWSVWTDHCKWCLEDTICECPSCRVQTQLKKFYHIFERGTRYSRSPYCDSCQEWANRTSNSYPISASDLLALRAAQEGVCAICRRLLTGDILHTDHCHARKVVRGLLCNKCNPALGLYNDDPALLRAAADYLEQHAKSTR